MAVEEAKRPIWRNAFLAALGLAVVAFCTWGIDHGIEEARLLRSDPDAPLAGHALSAALDAGRHVFAARCASCHEADGRGDPALGVPNLTDHDWLYGAGAVSELEQTIAYGIRSRHPKGWNLAEMPAFGRPDPRSTYKIIPLTPGEIRDVIAFLASRRHDPADPDAVARGGAIFSSKGGCFDCHGGDGAGDPAIGAPNLIDRIWLYGDGSPDSVFSTIVHGRHGVMPAFVDRLSAGQIREVALYVHSLSQAAPPTPKETR
jgi:cytochrome c oxidase cbb3-type subunit III